jgi:hypothetical protein
MADDGMLIQSVMDGGSSFWFGDRYESLRLLRPSNATGGEREALASAASNGPAKGYWVRTWHGSNPWSEGYSLTLSITLSPPGNHSAQPFGSAATLLG